MISKMVDSVRTAAGAEEASAAYRLPPSSKPVGTATVVSEDTSSPQAGCSAQMTKAVLAGDEEPPAGLIAVLKLELANFARSSESSHFAVSKEVGSRAYFAGEFVMPQEHCQQG